MLTLFAASATADDEASNVPVASTSRHGNCYAKSVPTEHYGENGVTKVFFVRRSDDQLVHTFSWYSKQVFLECNVAAPGAEPGVAVARMGPWNRGHQARVADLAFELYWNGRLIQRYSTLDISGSPDNVGSSVSHYVVIRSIEGYHWRSGNEYTFEVTTSDGRRLRFDAVTGKALLGHK